MASVHQGSSGANEVRLPASGEVQANDRSTDFVIKGDPLNVSNYAREGDDLVINMRSGEVVRIKDFFVYGVDFNHLVFTSADGGPALFTNFSAALTPTGDGIDDPLVTYYETTGSENGPLVPVLSAVMIGAVALTKLDNHSPPPKVAPAAPGNLIVTDTDHDYKPYATGTAAPGSTVTITWPDTTTTTAIADASTGNWSSKATTAQHSGDLHAHATDADGLSSPDVTVHYNNVTPPPSPENVTFTDPNHDNLPVASGTAEPGSTVTVHWTDNTTTTAIVDGNGHWDAKATTPQGSGDVIVTTTDQDGNPSAPADFPYHDTTPPPAPDHVAVSNGDQDNLPVTTGNAEPGSTVTVHWPDGTTTTTTADPTDGSWRSKATDVQGNGDVTAHATDAAGNVGPDTTVSYTDSSQLPVAVAIAAITDDTGADPHDFVTSDQTLIFSGTISAALDSGTGEKVQVSLDGGKTWHDATVTSSSLGWSWTYDNQSVTMPEGSYDVQARVVDAAGNASATAHQSVVIDVTGPFANNAVAITSYFDAVAPQTGDFYNNSSTNDTAPLLKGTVSGLEQGDAVKVYEGSHYLGDAQVVGGSWSLQLTGVTEGPHTYTAVITDLAGNAGTTSSAFTFTVDTVPPPPTTGPYDLIDDVLPDTGSIQPGTDTDDNTPTYTGFADQTQVTMVHVYDNGTLIGSAVVNPTDGSWSFTPTVALAAGAHSFSAQSVDAAGNTSAQTTGWDFNLLAVGGPATPAINQVLDDYGTATGPLQKYDTTDDKTPTISGTGDPGSVVTVYVTVGLDHVAVGSTTVLGDKTWSVTTSDLSQVPGLTGDGTKTLTADAKDGAGQHSPMTGDYPIVLDTTAPAQPAVASALDHVAPITGPIHAGDATDDSQPTFSGTGEVKSTITIYDGTTVIGSTTVQSDGSWSFTPSTPLGEGSHSITTTETDLAGNQSVASDPLNFSVDTSNVVVSFRYAVEHVGGAQDNLATGAATSDAAPTLVGTATAGAMVTISENGVNIGTAIADTQGNWNYILPTQSDGAHHYVATAQNAAGTTGTADFSLTVDTQPHAIPTIGGVIDDVGLYQGPLYTGDSTDDTTPTFSGTGATPGDIIRIYDGGAVLGSATVQPDGSWQYTVPPIGEGAHDLYVTSVTPVGVESGKSGAFHLTVDTTPPAALASISSIAEDTGPNAHDFITSDTTLVVTATVTQAIDAGEKVQVSLDNGATWHDATPVSGLNYQYDATATPLTEGNYTFQARVIDAASNVSTAGAQTVVIDTTHPSATAAIAAFTDDVPPVTGDNFTSGAYTDDTTPLLHGTVAGAMDAGDVVAVYRDGSPIGTALADGSGQWNYQESSVLPDGGHTYTAYVMDTAGNLSVVSPDFIINVQTGTNTSGTVEITSYTDDQDPVTGDFVSGTSTNDSSPVLNGTVTNLGSGDTVKVYAGTGATGTYVGDAHVDANGSWTLQLNGLADGVYTYTAVITTAAGQPSVSSNNFSFTVDTVPPAGTPTIVNYTDVVPPATGDFGAGTTTDDRQPTLHGTYTGATLGSDEYLLIFSGSTLLGTATTDSAGNWSLKLPSLDNGATYNVEAVAVDQAGNYDPAHISNIFTFTVQLNVTVSSQNTIDTTPLITGTTGFALQTGEVLDVTVNGKTYSSATGDVQIDAKNFTWALQIPDANALPAGTPANPDMYVVTAAVMDGTQTISTGTGNLGVSNEAFTIYVPPPPNATNKATAMTVGETGNWRLFNNAVVMDSTATDSTNMATFSNNVLTGNMTTSGYGGAVMATALFMDFNRDGYIDIFGEDSEYIGGQQAFVNMGSQPGYVQTGIVGSSASASNSGYYAFQVGSEAGSRPTNYGVDFSGSGTGYTRVNGSANTYVYYSAVVAWDAYGTGWVGMVTGDANPNDSGAVYGYNSAFIVNNNGIFSKDPDIANASAGTGVNATGAGRMSSQGLPYKEVSAVDINNDGCVDVVYHMARATAYISTPSNPSGASTTNNGSLVVVANNQAATGALSVPEIVTNVFYYSNGASGGNLQQNGISMTWGDFNGDGWLDLYVGSTTGGTNGTDPTTAASGKIFFNDGAGLLSGTPNASNNGIMTPGSDTYTLPGNFMAGGSVAVDWLCNGKMDIVAVPFYPNGPGSNPPSGTPTSDQQVMLFTNTTPPGGATNFTQSILHTIPIIPTTLSQTSASNPNAGTAISGLLSMDINWDGAKDMVVLTGTGIQDASSQLSGAVVIMNPNVPNYGTSLHFRILDQNGVNSFFGNTVQLVDDRNGQVVSTQVINPQSGVQTEDSSAIVDFYGLNANDTYSLVLLRSVNGVSQDVGGVHSVGTNTIENYNAAWGGIAPTDANHAYVLTAASDSAVNDTYNPTASGPVIDPTATSNPGSGINMTGIVGTGYNDTFFATQGHNLYEGGGGTTVVSGVSAWSPTGGQDMVDYKLAGSTAVTVDLSRSVEQNTGFGYATFHNIEGIAGGSGNDTFTDAASGGNIFNGRGGNDTFNLIHGGHDTLLYQVVTVSDGTGGNGADTVNGWFTGLYEATPQADRIDLSALLQGYTPTGADGTAARFINGVATINAGDTITQYLSVTHSGNDTVIGIDRDGAGGQFQSATLVTLKNVDVDLATLLANHQVVV